MAMLPPVLIELRASASEFMATMGEAQAHVEKLGAKGATTGQQMRQHVGAGLMAVGAAATGAGALLLDMGEKVEASHKALEVAVKNTGHSYEEYGKQVDSAVSRQEKFGHKSQDTQEALAVLTRATGNTGTALKDMALVTELAAAKHISLADAAGTVAKMHAGAYRPLKEFGINLKDANAAAKDAAKAEKEAAASSDVLGKAKQKLADLMTVDSAKTKLSAADHIALRNAHDAVTAATARHDAAVNSLAAAHAAGAKAVDFNAASQMVLTKIHGTAEAQADTFGGRILGLKTHFEDMAATLGTKVGPALTIAGPALAGVGGIISSGVLPMVAKAIVSFGEMAASALASFASMIAEAAVWAAGMVASAAIAMAPFLPFILAIAAVGIAAYELYQHWDEVWGFIKRITGDAVKAIGKLLDDVIDFFKKLPRRILDALGDLANLLLDVGKSIVRGLKDGIVWLWDHEVAGWLNIGRWVKDAVGDLANLLFDVGKDIVNGLVAGIKAAWHLVTDVVGNLASHLPGPLKSVLGIGSPSKVFAALGRNIAEGLAMGINDSSGLVSSAIGNLGALATVSGSAAFGVSVSGGMAGGMSGGSSGITIQNHFHGDTYGMDDFKAKVVDAVTAGVVPKLRAAGVA